MGRGVNYGKKAGAGYWGCGGGTDGRAPWVRGSLQGSTAHRCGLGSFRTKKWGKQKTGKRGSRGRGHASLSEVPLRTLGGH